ncbi:MAG TPA: OmcA/MtrC family decaheme c-type cytochrome [Woeseiaceae bacterium]|nr:OmcA/MtrC family decaheme c-type cytochrome [Woeseiaceae bacterium]
MIRSSRIASLILFGLFIAGCEGNDGAPGADGAPGPAGPPGPPGPSTGSGVPVDSAERINIAVSGVAVPAGGGAPTVQLTLTNDLNQGLVGLPAGDIRFVLSQLTPGTGGGSSEWQSYITRDSGGIPNAQANTESATAGTFVDNNDGTYTYTFANDLDAYPAGPVFDAAKTHRIGIEIRGQAPISSNGIFTFVPAGGDPTFERRIVDNDTCNACHDRLEFHGGPRTDVDYCVTCHNPYSIDGDTGNTVDMKALIHNIHAGRSDYVIIGHGGTVHDYSEVVWTQDIRNCQTCHEESDANTPQASNWREVPNRAACGTCHYDDGDPNNLKHDYAIEDGIHPAGLVFTDDTQCVDCHGPDATVGGGVLQIARVHEIPTQLASAEFQFNILSVTNTAVGEFPVVQFSVTNPLNGDAPYNIQTDVEFTTCSFGASRLAVSVGWSTSDYTNTGSGNSPAQPVSMNPLTACGGASTDNGDGTFTVTSPTAVPAGTTGTLAVTIDGHPAVDINGTIERIAVTNAVAYSPVTDATAQPRRNAIAIERCDQCHNQLSIHGNNRTDEPEVCVVCHNPNATDVNRRNPPCSDDLGADDVPIDFKRMIHRIHASGATGVPYGVCGFGNSSHVFDVTYPGHLNNCEGCHEPGGYYPVDPAAVLGTTVSVGADPASPLDDVVISPNASVCSSCHVSSLAKTHMEQNGADFAATKAADSTLISSGVESCQLCHGAGRSAGVDEVHGVSDFQFN